jgi:alkylation response protein AidB-like acyl-CoA dehydrogenase
LGRIEPFFGPNGLGSRDDTPVVAMWRQGRGLRIAGGPEEVRKMVIARRELSKYA